MDLRKGMAVEKFFNGRPAWAEIDLNVLKDNIRSIQAGAPGKRVISVVKANAYGHGMLPVAEAIRQCGVRDFAVAILGEALELRAADPDSSILILGYTPGELAAQAVAADLTVTVYSLEVARQFAAEARRQGKTVKLAVALDTGMSRIGFPATDESLQEIIAISQLPGIILEELFTHFSTADETDKTYSHLQMQRYHNMKQGLDGAGVRFTHYHMANSAAIIDLPEAHYDSVRPGIIQYGYYPSDEVAMDRVKVRPILSLYAGLAMVKPLAAGIPVGYGNTWTASRESVIGTIPVGYADGYNRRLSNRGQVLFQGKALPIRGRVCMDQFMVDLTDGPSASQGDVVTLLGQSGDVAYWADDMAKDLGTISYEVTCNISLRVPRKYIGR